MGWLDELKELANRLLDDVKALEREQSELEILIRQTHSEMERISPQEASAQRRLREVEANLQAYGPAELRSAYATARELELKLFVLRTQLDSLGRKKDELVARQKSLGEMHTKVSRAILDAESQLRDAGVGSIQLGSADLQAQFDQQLAYLSQVMIEGPAQSLVNASIVMELIRRMAESSPDKVGSELDRLSQAIEQALAQIKYAVYLAGPPSLQDQGLEGALKRLVKLLASYGGFKLALSLQGSERHWPMDWAAWVYRMVTGMLLLPLRHKVSEGSLSVGYTDDIAEISLRAPLVEGPDMTDQALLDSLKARCEALGGKFYCDPPEGKIEAVSVKIPVPGVA